MLKQLFAVLSLFFLKNVFAGTPTWTLSALTATTLSVSKNNTVTVKYRVTNQSKYSHTLVMTPIQGITLQANIGDCAIPALLSSGESCILTLSVSGAKIARKIVGGPAMCQEGAGDLLCYQPNQEEMLNITPTHEKNAYIYDADGTLWPYDIAVAFIDWRGVRDEYEEMCRLYGNEVCYPWVAKLWNGMTENEVNEQMNAFVWWAEANQPRVKPFSYMREHINSNAPSQNWIVSASPSVIVKAWVQHTGLAVPQSNIFGIETVIQNGRYTDEIGSPITYRNGKVATIKKAVTDPIGFVAGNSLTDYEMLLYGSYKFNAEILLINPNSEPAGCSGYGNIGDLIQPTWKVMHLDG